ncbi:MAG: hypothetical protein LUD82_09730 [Clostridiales bacterium]|nr:hypothetical protein [Clostridiales bacterium]MCD8127694.1 hypothetical protein [Clostridiales bacterium]
MSYETKQYIVTGKAANVRKFPDSSSGAIVTTLNQGDIVEADASGTYTNTRGGSTTVYLPVVIDGTRRWAASGNFSEATPLNLAAANVADVYNACIGCTHKSGSYTWATAMSAKQVNCAIPASRAATLAGILPDGKLISHTTAVGSNILTSKNTIAKAISGYSNLDTSKCTIVRIAKKYADMDAAYKKAGVFFVQDSNIAVCAGDGDIYACHDWSKQMSNGKYTKVKLSSGYTKNSYILYAIVPND